MLEPAKTDRAARPVQEIGQSRPSSFTPTYFQEQCAACGRTLRVLVDFLGHRVACQHCGRQFVARNEAVRRPQRRENPFQRAEQLIRAAAPSLRW